MNVYKYKQTTKNADENIADDNCRSFKGYHSKFKVICFIPNSVDPDQRGGAS